MSFLSNLLNNLFKSKQQRAFEAAENKAREDRRRRSDEMSKKRELEKQFADAERQIKEREAKNEKLRDEALKLVKEGRETEAREKTSLYKLTAESIAKSRRQMHVLRSNQSKLEFSSLIAGITEALKDLAVGVAINPDQTEHNFDVVQDVVDGFEDVDGVLEDAYNHEMRAAERSGGESIDEMMARLKEEAGLTSKPDVVPAAENKDNTNGSISKGRERLERVLDEGLK